MKEWIMEGIDIEGSGKEEEGQGVIYIEWWNESRKGLI